MASSSLRSLDEISRPTEYLTLIPSNYHLSRKHHATSLVPYLWLYSMLSDAVNCIRWCTWKPSESESESYSMYSWAAGNQRIENSSQVEYSCHASVSICGSAIVGPRRSQSLLLTIIYHPLSIIPVHSNRNPESYLFSTGTTWSLTCWFSRLNIFRGASGLHNKLMHAATGKRDACHAGILVFCFLIFCGGGVVGSLWMWDTVLLILAKDILISFQSICGHSNLGNHPDDVFQVISLEAELDNLPDRTSIRSRDAPQSAKPSTHYVWFPRHDVSTRTRGNSLVTANHGNQTMIDHFFQHRIYGINSLRFHCPFRSPQRTNGKRAA